MTRAARMRARYLARLAERMCVDCGHDSYGLARCFNCRQKRAERQARYRLKRAA